MKRNSDGFVFVFCALLGACGNDDAAQPDAAGDASDDVFDASDDAGVDVSADVSEGSGFAWPAVYWGDLHTHSCNSIDVYIMNAPIVGGRGFVAPSDHCDFARFCSQLDFWTITDHQTFAPTHHWTEAIEAMRACNATTGGDTDAPSLVTFAGYEWQQSSTVLADNFGHRNVILRESDAVPTHAVAAGSQVTQFTRADINLLVDLANQVDPPNTPLYEDIRATLLGGLETPICDRDTEANALPATCIADAATPAQLYEKLRQWGLPALVIPHAMAWAQHHPPHMQWDHQLVPEHVDNALAPLVEIYSGHGSMESYRAWRSAVPDAEGVLQCPEPSAGFLPCCWRAGEIAASRSPACAAAPESAACAAEVERAQRVFLDAGRFGGQSIAGIEFSEWLDCDQCNDCFQPAEGYRPGGSVQAALARTHFGPDGSTTRVQWGFVGATDSHGVGPGTGYKEFRGMSDIFGPTSEEFEAIADLALDRTFPDHERQNSFYYAGGLTGVVAAGPDRGAIFDAMAARRTYATSGDRIEVVFALQNAPAGPTLMGSVVELDEAPAFRVLARGAPVQRAGCAPETIAAAPAGFVERACMGECFYPTDERHALSRVEVVRIRPQIEPNEPIETLIDDPFVVLPCGEHGECDVTFVDDEYVSAGRPAVYYVRAIQEPTPQLNADNLRCESDADGRCTEVHFCEGGFRGAGDDCLALAEERAWASPIYVNPQ